MAGPDIHAQPFRFHHYTSEDGLSQSLIRKIVQTRDGFLWFATEDGLNRFDGQRFRVYRKRNTPNALSWSHVYDMVEDTAAARLWLGTSFKGVNILDLRTDSIHIAPRPGSRLQLPDEAVNAIAIAGDMVLVGTRKGVSLIDRNTRDVRYIAPTDATVRSLHPEPGTSLSYAFCENGDILRIDLRRQTHLRLPADSLLGPGPHSVWKAWRDRNGEYWVCTRKGLFRASGYTSLQPGGISRFLLRFEGVDYSNRYYNTVHLDNRGRYWIDVDSIGLFLLDVDGRPLRKLSYEPDNRYSLADNNVYQVFDDASGNLWFGTEKGIDKIQRSDPALRSIGQEDRRLRDIFNRIFSLQTTSEGIVLIGHQGNLQWYDPRSGTFGEAANRTGIDFGRTYFIEPVRPDTYWVGTREGMVILRRSGRTWTLTLPADMPELDGIKRISCLRAIGPDRYLLGNLERGGLGWWDRSARRLISFRHVPGDSTSIAHDKVISIHPDARGTGHYWVATEAGFSRFDTTTKHFRNYSVRIDGKPRTSVVNEIHDDGRYLWMAVYQEGLLRWEKATGAQRLFTEAEGLPNTNLYNLRADVKGRLWITSNTGLLLFDTARQTFTTLTMDDGLPNNEFNRFAVSGDPAVLRFGGIGGMVEVDAAAFEPEKHTLPVTITDFQYLDSSRFRPYEDLTHGVVLDHDHNTFTVSFSVLDYRPTGYHRYRYMLRGWDRDWIYADARNTITYSNIKPGDYEFLVSDDDSHFLPQRPPTRLSVRVIPAWYQTLWFKALVVASIAFLLALTVRYYILYRTRRREAELERRLAIQYERQRISADLHDEIGATLSSINIYAGMAREVMKDNAYIRPIVDNVNRVIGHLDELVWSIRPTQDTLGVLLERLNDFAVPAAVSRGIELNVDMSAEHAGILLEPDTRHHLYMMLKELVNNALRHSGGRSVRVAVGREGDALTVTVADDGRGFDPDGVKGDRNGLRNLRTRAREMRAHFELQSTGAGTQALIRVPLTS